VVPRRNREPPMGAHIRLSCSARAGIMINSRDPLQDYTDVLSFMDILSKWSLHFVSICHDIWSKSIFRILPNNISWFGTYLQRGSYMLPHPWRSSFESRDEILLRVEGCDTPGVYFALCREIYPNLKCSVKICISLSHLSPFIKLLMKVSPSLELFDLKNSQIWSLLELLFLRAKANSKVNLVSQLLSRQIYSDSRCYVIQSVSESAFSIVGLRPNS
jgi:hypothetical protein